MFAIDKNKFFSSKNDNKTAFRTAETPTNILVFKSGII